MSLATALKVEARQKPGQNTKLNQVSKSRTHLFDRQGFTTHVWHVLGRISFQLLEEDAFWCDLA